MYFDISRGQRERQAYHLSDGGFIAQNRRESRFTDVHRMATDYVRVAWIHLYIYFHPESRMPARFGEFATCDRFQI